MPPRLHFTIIVPAHNEELYLADTLAHLVALDWPDDCYDVLVVENGSTDQTLAVARQYEGGNLHVFESGAVGVSAAKNFGVERIPRDSDWVVFLDADTILTAGFLEDLSAALARPRHDCAVGTTRVQPLGGDWRSKAWFAFYDLSHRFGKGSYSIQIARRSLFPGLRFDERLTMGEDLLMIRQARLSGKFLFVPTKTVYTSTRRFEAVGYWRLFAYWTMVSLLPTTAQKLFGYETVR